MGTSTHGNPTGGGAGTRLSDMIPFFDVAKLLDKISSANSNDKRKSYLQNFIKYYREKFKEHHRTLESDKAGGDSMYPFIRILIPDVDRGRRAYGFKYTALSRMFAQILGLDKNSRDGKSLLNFKDPTKAGASVGDLPGTIFRICESRFGSKEIKHPMMLTEFHEFLNGLSRSHDSDVNQEAQKKLIRASIQKLSPLEIKWLVKLLLKDMRLGFSSTKSTVYGLLHKDAKQLSEKIGGDLELLCQKVNNPDAEVSDIDISLFHHFLPMLATRMDIIDSNFEGGGSQDAAGPSKKKDFVSLPAPPFYVETKWDGERFQIHYDGKEFKYFSRRAFDFTRKFDETITPRLRGRIRPGIKSFILDGEMMAYHKKYKIFTQKGYNIDVKTMNASNENHCPVFVAFDLVYFNGASLIKMSAKERREKMLTVFEPKEDVIRVSEIKVMNSKAEVIDCLNSAIDDGEEGLIAKDMNSKYEPGKRGPSWLKIKPEYLEDNMVNDLDLVIIGAYYTESVRRGGELTHFLVGLVDNSKGTEMYYPIAKVGSGRLRSVEVKELVKELTPRLGKTLPNNVQIRARKKPDFMIDPRKSIVVQVKASEIIPSDVYSVNYTLRFPRITAIRRDKSPREVMTAQEFTRLREACGGKLAQRTDGKRGKSSHPFTKKRRHQSDSDNQEDSDDGRPIRKKSPVVNPADDADDDPDEPLPGPSARFLSINKAKPMLPAKTKPAMQSPSKKGTPSTGTAAISPKKVIHNNIFNSKIFCVYGSTSWKSQMEIKIRQFGGDISQSPEVKGVFAIVGERLGSVLVQKALRTGKYDVLHGSWIDKCISEGTEVKLVPCHYMGMSRDTRELFADDYDEYGDSFRGESTLEETKELVKRVMKSDEVGNSQSSSASSSTTASPRKKLQEPEESSDTDFEMEMEDSDSGRSHTSTETQLLGELFPEHDRIESISWAFMKDVEIAFRGKVSMVLKSKFEFYGGKVSSNETDRGITHIIICNEGDPSLEDHSRALVVKQKWLEDCLEKKEVLDERPYMIGK